MSRMGAHQSARSETVDWLSPPEWVKALGPFDLDPCCPPNMPWRTADRMLTRVENGLSCEWSGRVWLNPPYGPPKVVEPWMARMARNGSGIALIFARTETRCWFKYVWTVATGALFVEGRPHFHDRAGNRAKGNSGCPVALIAYSAYDMERLVADGPPGKAVIFNQPLNGGGKHGD